MAVSLPLADARPDNIPEERIETPMRKRIVVSLLALAVAAVAAGSAAAVVRDNGRSCGQKHFPAVVQAVTANSVTLLAIGQQSAVTYRLVPRTQIRKHDHQAGTTALAPGQKVIAEVRTCQGGGGPTELVAVSIKVVGGSDGPGGGGGDQPAPPPVPSTCARGDFTAPVTTVGTDSISFTSNGAEGLKSFSVAVTGETVISKDGGSAEPLSAVNPGDRLHVWVVRCAGTPPTLRATKIVDLGPAATPPPTTTTTAL